MVNFKYIKYNAGRIGQLQTQHGIIETPAFLFCATHGAIKGVSPWDMKNLNTQVLLVNTLHLFQHRQLIKDSGGIHKFMSWNAPILSDSGGYQLYSFRVHDNKQDNMNKHSLIKITEEGCYFRNIRNGNKYFFTPELSIETQVRYLGVDFAVALDECPTDSSWSYTKKSMDRSHRWETRSINEFKKWNKYSGLYAVMHGATYKDLRKISADYINNNDFFGIGIGGLLGDTKEVLHETMLYSKSLLNYEKPVHGLGIGDIDNIIYLAPYIDTFDCVSPTRLARHYTAVCKGGNINIRNKVYSTVSTPIDLTCYCLTCQNFSLKYLHYLIKAGELLAMQAILIHNVYTMNRLMLEIRHNLKTSYDIREYYNKMQDWINNSK